MSSSSSNKIELFTEREKLIIKSALALLVSLKAHPKVPIAGVEDSEIYDILKKIPLKEEEEGE